MKNTIFLAQISVVICQDDAKINLLLDKAPKCLRRLIVIKEVQPTTIQRAKSKGINIMKYEEVEELGASKLHNEVVNIFTFFKIFQKN